MLAGDDGTGRLVPHDIATRQHLQPHKWGIATNSERDIFHGITTCGNKYATDVEVQKRRVYHRVGMAGTGR